MVCFIPKVHEEMYAALKKLMLIKCPMINQLITAQRILGKPDKYGSFATKIVVQMAAKLGAKPWAVKIPPKNVMVSFVDFLRDCNCKKFCLLMNYEFCFFFVKNLKISNFIKIS